MGFIALVIAFCAAVTVHNLEEALFLPAWSKVATRFHAPVGAFEFRFAVVAVTLAAYVCAALAAAGSTLGVYLVCGYALGMAVNAFVPHLAATVALRRYAPGTATGLLLNLPIGVALIAFAAREGRIAWPTFVWAGPMTMVALVAAIRPLFALGRAWVRRRSARQSC